MLHKIHSKKLCIIYKIDNSARAAVLEPANRKKGRLLFLFLILFAGCGKIVLVVTTGERIFLIFIPIAAINSFTISHYLPLSFSYFLFPLLFFQSL